MMQQQAEARHQPSIPKKQVHARLSEAFAIGKAFADQNVSAGSTPRSPLPLAERIFAKTRAPVYLFSNDVCIWRIFLRLYVEMFNTPYSILAEELDIPVKKLARWIASEGNDTDNIDVSLGAFEECLHHLLGMAQRAKYYDRLGLELARLTRRPYKDFALFATGDEEDEPLSFSERMAFYDELIQKT